MKKMIGGSDEERLFLFDQEILNVRKTNMPHMKDLVSRHKARYHFAAFFARDGMKVLDFPCGSGYGSKFFEKCDYIGMDYCETTVEYAKYYYGGRHNVKFVVDDLTSPKKLDSGYDLIVCVDGIEHIDMVYQRPLVSEFYKALKPGGTLFISTPESAKGVSGKSDTNPYHKYELSETGFRELLLDAFTDVQLFIKEDKNHKGEIMRMMFGIATKEGA